MREGVPGGRSNPGVFWFGAMDTDKAGGIGDTESANGSNISEEGVIDFGRYETGRKGCGTIGGLRQADNFGGGEKTK